MPDDKNCGVRRWRVPARVIVLSIAGTAAARAQDPPPPEATPEVFAAAATTPREAELEARVRQLEAMVGELSTRMGQMNSIAPPAVNPAPGVAAGGVGGADDDLYGLGGSAGDRGPLDAGIGAGNQPTIGGSAGNRSPTAPAPAPNFEMPAAPPNLPAKSKFANGFQIATDDDEYQSSSSTT